MDACPACTASMREGLLHCGCQDCIWLKCGKCGAIIDVETRTYFRGTNLWGNQDGYLRST